MEKFTRKEKDCLIEYTNDLLSLMEDEHICIVSDNKNSYTEEEIKVLAEKVEKING